MRGSVFIYDYVHKLYYDCNEYHLELVLTLSLKPKLSILKTTMKNVLSM